MDIKEKINKLRLRITEYDSGAEDHFFKMGILDILEILNGREARQNEISKNVNQALKNINARLLNHGKALQNFKEQLNNIEELEKKIFDPPGNPQEELKPCNLCGRTVEYLEKMDIDCEGRNTRIVQCICGLSLKIPKTEIAKKQFIEHWNTPKNA